MTQGWWRRLARGRDSRTVVAGFAAIALGVILIGTAAFGGATAFLQSDPTPTPTNTAVPTSTPTETPEPTATPVPSNSPISRLVIPALGIDTGSIITMGVDANGVMESPWDPFEVAWYDFSALPGGGEGNIIMAGHVDWITVGPAVFYSLRNLGQGEEVRLTTADGATHVYRVVSNTTYHVANVPINEVVGHTEVESVTLITCGGTFNSGSGSYDSRVVVRAERVQ